VALQGKTILITGASSGLGRAMAVSLSRGDNNLIVTARREALLHELAEEVEANGSRCTVVAADAIDPVASLAVIDAGVAAYGRIDVALLNAGGGLATSMATATAADVVRMMRINYDTMVNFLCPMIQHMRGIGGTIGWTGSPAGFFGMPKKGPYSAAKAAGRILFDTCRIELAGSKIRLGALYPGFTATPGLDPDDVPVKSLIIQPDRAVREMLAAIERGRSHRIFPKRIKFLILLARLLPEWLRRRILALGVPASETPSPRSAAD
jgi:short-subunit dehydrogenase